MTRARSPKLRNAGTAAAVRPTAAVKTAARTPAVRRSKLPRTSAISTPKVALLIETSRGYGRSMLRGIARYARHHGPWELFVTPGDFAQALPKMKQWGGDGIIARVETLAVAKGICAVKLPTVMLDYSQNIPLKVPELARYSEVVSDSANAARLAAEHLLDRGY